MLTVKFSSWYLCADGAIKSIFDRFDKDGNGTIDAKVCGGCIAYLSLIKLNLQFVQFSAQFILFELS